MAKKKKKGSFGRMVLTFLCVLLALVLAVLIAGTVYVNSFLDKINRFEDASEPTYSAEEEDLILSETDPEEEIGEVEEIDEADIDKPDAPAETIEEDEHIINILLIGQDRRPGQGRQRSDAMILCTVNTEKKTLVMTSFLRDLYVQFPDFNGRSYSDNRINATYVIGGMEMLDETLKLNFGVHVDHNIEVDFTGFEKIIDLLGGVQINLTKAEANWMGDGLKAGVNQLNGEKALQYARIRKLDGDFNRTNRQRTVLAAVFEKVRGMSLTKLTELAESIMPMITTDMTNSEIIGYVLEFFPILSELEITTQHIPAEGTYKHARVRGMAVLLPDFEENIQILKDTIG